MSNRFYRNVVTKVVDSFWKRNHAGSSPVIPTNLTYTVVLLIYFNDNYGCVKFYGVLVYGLTQCPVTTQKRVRCPAYSATFEIIEVIPKPD